jgi:hypothetical protein
MGIVSVSRVRDGMKRFFLSLPGLAALLFFHSAGAQPPPISAPTLPVSEVKPGMQGEWKTVISGSQIETFRFEVLGTARNFTGPQRDVIIARALDESQIVSGPVAGAAARASSTASSWAPTPTATPGPRHRVSSASPPSPT